MKRSMFLITLILVLLSGCTSASNTSQPATVTPGVVPRLDPSPTPSGSTLPVTCRVTDLNVYINEANGYCFAFPSRFTLGDQPSDQPDVRGPAIDDSAEPIHATLSGESAWKVEPIPAMPAYRIVFVQHNGFMFRLMYWPVDIPEAQPDLNDLMQTTLGSFAFTK
jgi:hypothetical protein